MRRVTPGQGDLKDSGTENIPPAYARCARYGVAGPLWGVPAEARRAKAGKGEKVR